MFQQPKEDLKVFAAPGRKGKKKATEEELLKDEIQGCNIFLVTLTFSKASCRNQVCFGMLEATSGT